jgi:DMSO/TMAO reductase YedYZ molybdopterin-dependent catalytic subunit
VLSPAGLVRRLPLEPHELLEPITPQRDLFVLAHIGIPRIDAASWQLDLCGEVERPRRLTYEDLRRLPKRTVETFHQCAGFPRRPDLPTRRIANVVWSGAAVRDLLAEAKIRSGARYLWAYGLDRGDFEGKSEQYVKDLPLARLGDADWLLAYEVNGEPLTAEHGFPVRLVAPGFYGTNCVKWLCRLEVARERHPGVFTNALYNDPVPGTAERRPVWEAGPESVIVAPRIRETIPQGATEVWGWAWGSRPVVRVDVSCDGGETWAEAALSARRQWSWQRFAFRWAQREPGAYELLARATDDRGTVQPRSAARNAVHTVRVTVTPS